MNLPRPHRDPHLFCFREMGFNGPNPSSKANVIETLAFLLMFFSTTIFLLEANFPLGGGVWLFFKTFPPLLLPRQATKDSAGPSMFVSPIGFDLGGGRCFCGTFSRPFPPLSSHRDGKSWKWNLFRRPGPNYFPRGVFNVLFLKSRKQQSKQDL